MVYQVIYKIKCRCQQRKRSLTYANGYKDEPHEGDKAEVTPATKAAHRTPRDPTNDVRDRETLRHVMTIN
jgi:hypothetical protein